MRVLRTLVDRLPRYPLFFEAIGGWKMNQNDQSMTWQSETKVQAMPHHDCRRLYAVCLVVMVSAFKNSRFPVVGYLMISRFFFYQHLMLWRNDQNQRASVQVQWLYKLNWTGWNLTWLQVITSTSMIVRYFFWFTMRSALFDSPSFRQI